MDAQVVTAGAVHQPAAPAPLNTSMASLSLTLTLSLSLQTTMCRLSKFADLKSKRNYSTASLRTSTNESFHVNVGINDAVLLQALTTTQGNQQIVEEKVRRMEEGSETGVVVNLKNTGSAKTRPLSNKRTLQRLRRC
jgi:hypothetical protein